MTEETWVRERGSWFYGPGNHPATVTVEYGYVGPGDRFVPTRAMAFPSDRPECAREIPVGQVRAEHLKDGRMSKAGWGKSRSLSEDTRLNGGPRPQPKQPQEDE